jgi:hypothetical protein
MHARADAIGSPTETIVLLAVILSNPWRGGVSNGKVEIPQTGDSKPGLFGVGFKR